MKVKQKHIGKVMDAHGIRGDVYCIVFSGDVSWLDKVQTLNLHHEDFKIKKIKAFKKGFIASLEGFDNRNKAEEYIGAELRVPEDLFVSEDGEALFLNEILGFTVFDKKNEIGSISGFSFNGLQDLLIIKKEGKDLEIPFVKEFVSHIDYEKKQINMNLPEGLLEINEADSI
jgi:16S rRNA processing protein RimM